MLDIERLLKASKNIYVRGLPTTKEREELIEEAIKQIQINPKGALRKEYLGIKNYAEFGDQRCDNPYGDFPRHGTIVFSIGRIIKPEVKFELGEDEIYYLLVALNNPSGFGETKNVLGEIIHRDLEMFIDFVKKNRREKAMINFIINTSNDGVV